MQHTPDAAQFAQGKQGLQLRGKIGVFGPGARHQAGDERVGFREFLKMLRLGQRMRLIHVAFDKHGFFNPGTLCGGKVVGQQEVAFERGQTGAPGTGKL